MSTARKMHGGWVPRQSGPRGANGRGLCRWCNLEVPPRRFTFCSAWCVHEWKLRSQPQYLREQVLLRDKGRCAACGVDTLFEVRRLRRSRGDRRAQQMAHWGLKASLRKSLWDADHIVPVVEGGGECDLGNIRTLCLRCHRAATAALLQRMRRAKVAGMLQAETASNLPAAELAALPSEGYRESANASPLRLSRVSCEHSGSFCAEHTALPRHR